MTPASKTLIFGGAGFVGLNIAERLLGEGREVVLFDRQPLPAEASAAFASLPGRLDMVIGDVNDPHAVAHAFGGGIDSVVLGAAVTADAVREAREPEAILACNLVSLAPILRMARAAHVRRIVNLGSAAAYGQAAIDLAAVDEDTPPRPTGLYGITKFGAEMVGQRLASLWSLDFVTLRLSAVFGPWERATGVRDTTSPQHQISEAALRGEPALLARPGLRDWVYAPDVAEAVCLVAAAPALRHAVYNVSSPWRWSALAWGEALAGSPMARPGFACRLAGPGETANIALHSTADRGALSTDRLRRELGWQARFGLAEAAAHFDPWCRKHAVPHKEAP